MANQIISPTFIPRNVAEVQQLQLLNQVQNGTLPQFDILILNQLLHLPLLSIETKLAIYNFLSSLPFVSSIHLSQGWFAFVLLMFPLLMLGLLIVSVVIVFYLLRNSPLIISFILSRFNNKVEKKTFLELTFPSDTSKSAYATQQLYALLHTLAKQKTFSERLLGQKKIFGLEIVSTKDLGIRYILATTGEHNNVVKRGLLSYLPGIKIKETGDYLDNNIKSEMSYGVVELKLSSHFALPLSKQKVLDEYDPISYLTGNMIKLNDDELIAFQIITTPLLASTHKRIVNKINDLRNLMYQRQPLASVLSEGIFQKIAELPGISLIVFFFKIPLAVFRFVLMFIYSMFLGLIDPNGKAIPFLMTAQAMNKVASQALLNPYEQELQGTIKEKIDQQLFESSVRILVVTKDREEFQSRVSGLMASFGVMDTAFQGISTKGSILPSSLNMKQRLSNFRKRTLSYNAIFNKNPILSISELSDLYHFPYTDTTKTEDLVKLYSKELPAPLSLKRNKNLDVVFGKNTYGETVTDIGLTEEERQTHMYILGRTGSGKTTLMFSMAKHDIEQGRGLAFIDPHGDVAEDLVASIPLSRKDDLIYVNPIDLKFPIGINLLELTPDLDEDDAELEKEVVAEGVISLFRKVFSKDETTNAHRIEYILRNTIYTAFTIEGCTLFTINKILTNPTFRKQAISKLKDEDLIDFWKYEFGKAGDFQVIKMTQGVTAKVGRFMRSPTAKRIIEQSKSTINFDDIINQGKILICNFSQGKLGEDSSRLMGTTIMTKLQQAALKRAYIPQSKRKSFYLYVDEFQTFATQSFTKMVTEGRKYRMPLIVAEQSTSQQKDRDITNIILANVTTVISFRSGNRVDEELMLNQFRPYLEDGAVMNLPRYQFYIKISAIESEEPFSGQTLFIPVKKDPQKIESLVEASRKNWAIVYQRSENQEEEKSTKANTQQTSNTVKKTQPKSGLPEKRKRQK